MMRHYPSALPLFCSKSLQKTRCIHPKNDLQIVQTKPSAPQAKKTPAVLRVPITSWAKGRPPSLSSVLIDYGDLTKDFHLIADVMRTAVHGVTWFIVPSAI